MMVLRTGARVGAHFAARANPAWILDRTGAHGCIRARIRTRTRAHVHTRTRAHVHTRACIPVRARAHPCACACVRACGRAPTRAYARAHVLISLLPGRWERGWGWMRFLGGDGLLAFCAHRPSRTGILHCLVLSRHVLKDVASRARWGCGEVVPVRNV